MEHRENEPMSETAILPEELNLDLDEEDIEIIRSKKVSGKDFLGLTTEKLENYGLQPGPASRIAELVKEIKGEKENFDSFLKHINFKLSAVEFTGTLPKNDIEPYEWNDYTDSDPNQLELISQYLNQHLKPNLPKDYVVFNVANHSTLLPKILLFHSRSKAELTMWWWNRKLKKVLQEQSIWQAIAEMVAADFLTNEEIKAIGVLTDLNERWHLFWLEEGKKIMMVKLSHRKKALDIISRMVKMMRVPGLPGGQRIKIYDNVYTQVDDIAPLEDFYEEISEEDILRHKTRKAIDLIINNPLFSDVFSGFTNLPPRYDWLL
ncbi:6422_t:CDS:2 [Funneliformis caledonium]|uniref:6422_t:CDS:1 n=1 Tax=Funneliformis caledonium TaxID=1117310 RepID=A0A9N9G1U8_9GLOM|nr:6422_t:CDS:2 [Funneliformis caledonium]